MIGNFWFCKQPITLLGQHPLTNTARNGLDVYGTLDGWSHFRVGRKLCDLKGPRGVGRSCNMSNLSLAHQSLYVSWRTHLGLHEWLSPAWACLDLPQVTSYDYGLCSMSRAIRRKSIVIQKNDGDLLSRVSTVLDPPL